MDVDKKNGELTWAEVWFPGKLSFAFSSLVGMHFGASAVAVL